MCWKPDKKNGFKVGTYNHLLDIAAITSEHPFPWKIIWRSKAPLRVAFFVWTVALGKILTIDNLRKRKVRIIDWCYMCKCNGESIDHLLLHCPIASDLWSMILVLFGVSWVMPKSVVELLACWQGCFGRHWNGHICMVILHCLMWCIWRERNSKSYEDTRSSLPNLKLLFFRTLLDWLGWQPWGTSLYFLLLIY